MEIGFGESSSNPIIYTNDYNGEKKKKPVWTFLNSDILMKMTKKVAESLEDKRKMSIFATSTRGIRRKDDNLYGSQSRFEPHFYEPSL